MPGKGDASGRFSAIIARRVFTQRMPIAGPISRDSLGCLHQAGKWPGVEVGRLIPLWTIPPNAPSSTTTDGRLLSRSICLRHRGMPTGPVQQPHRSPVCCYAIFIAKQKMAISNMPTATPIPAADAFLLSGLMWRADSLRCPRSWSRLVMRYLLLHMYLSFSYQRTAAVSKLPAYHPPPERLKRLECRCSPKRFPVRLQRRVGRGRKSIVSQ